MRIVTPKRYRYGDRYIIGIVLQVASKLEDIQSCPTNTGVLWNRRELKEILYFFELLDRDKLYTRYPAYKVIQRLLKKVLNEITNKENGHDHQGKCKGLHLQKSKTRKRTGKPGQFLRGSRKAQ